MRTAIFCFGFGFAFVLAVAVGLYDLEAMLHAAHVLAHAVPVQP
jgi:hypothetical protein